jgi:hypothetical protein
VPLDEAQRGRDAREVGAHALPDLRFAVERVVAGHPSHGEEDGQEVAHPRVRELLRERQHVGGHAGGVVRHELREARAGV